MCGTCGCSADASASTAGTPVQDKQSYKSAIAAHGHGGGQSATPAHDHAHGDDRHRTLELSRLVLGENDRLAERVRGILLAKGIVAINLVSSPGSGKTTLLEHSLEALTTRGLRCAVLVGDLATDHDARRLEATGVPAVQITTGNVCHLDAHMILHGLEHLTLDDVDVLFLENVGNLVCPASFDLGEDLRVVLTSTTEGEDKPQKYPTIFDGADLALITKMDLAEVLDVDLKALHAAITDVAPAARVIEISARTGIGIEEWLAFVAESAKQKRAIAV